MTASATAVALGTSPRHPPVGSVAAAAAPALPAAPASAAKLPTVPSAADGEVQDGADGAVSVAALLEAALAEPDVPRPPASALESLPQSFCRALPVVMRALRRARDAVAEADRGLLESTSAIAAVAAERKAHVQARRDRSDFSCNSPTTTAPLYLCVQQAATLRSDIEAAALATARAEIESTAAQNAETAVRTRLNSASLAELKSGGSGLSQELVARQSEAMTLRWRFAELEAKELELRTTLEQKFGPSGLEPFKKQTDALLRRKLGIMEVRLGVTRAESGSFSRL